MEVKADKIWFYDGDVYIIYGEYEELKLDFVTISPEYDKPISLEFIEKRYPDVKKVLFEGWLSGSLYNFNNYGHNEWTKVGETRGFA